MKKITIKKKNLFTGLIVICCGLALLWGVDTYYTHYMQKQARERFLKGEVRQGWTLLGTPKPADKPAER